MNPGPTFPELSTAMLTDHCHLRIPSQPDWIAPTVDYLVARASQCGAVHPNRAVKVMLALNEALTNSIIHGNLGISSRLKEESDRAFAQAVAARCSDPAYALRPVDIHVSYDGRQLRWVFSDQGDGFDVESVLGRLDAGEMGPLRPSGRGMMMIRAFIDELRYEDRGRRAVLVLHRAAGEEKRSEPRWPLNGRVHVAPIDDQGRVCWEDSRDAVSRNISTGGLAFLGNGLPPAERVLLTIPGSQPPVQVQAEVRHWHALGGNVVEVGCRFEAPDSPALAGAAPGPVAQLVAQLAERQKPFAERRSAQRVPYTECIEVELAGGEVLHGFGRDLSRGGIGFLAPRNLAHEVVGLRLPGHGQGPLVVRARVVRSTRLVEEFHDIAAQFLPD